MAQAAQAATHKMQLLPPQLCAWHGWLAVAPTHVQLTRVANKQHCLAQTLPPTTTAVLQTVKHTQVKSVQSRECLLGLAAS